MEVERITTHTTPRPLCPFCGQNEFGFEYHRNATFLECNACHAGSPTMSTKEINQQFMLEMLPEDMWTRYVAGLLGQKMLGAYDSDDMLVFGGSRCPYCGSNDGDIIEYCGARFVRCLKCQATGPAVDSGDQGGISLALEKWRARVTRKEAEMRLALKKSQNHPLYPPSNVPDGEGETR